MKTDELGVYDEFQFPDNLRLPLKIDRLNDAIAGADGQIIGKCNFSSEMATRILNMRRAEFVAALANGEIILRAGKVLRLSGSQWQEGKLVSTFLPCGEMTSEEFDALSKKIVSDSVAEPENNGMKLKDKMTKIEKKKYRLIKLRLAKFEQRLQEKYAS